MSAIRADYFDGKTSAKRAVNIDVDLSGILYIEGLDHGLSFRISDVRVAPRVAHTPRCIYFPDGSKCETDDHDAIDAILRRFGKAGASQWIHLLESKVRYVALSAVVTVALIWSAVVFGIPMLAKYAAYALPASADLALGAGTLNTLDKVALSPSTLDETVRYQLQERFATLTKAIQDGHSYRLEFRTGNSVGANAFALPSGIIVMTDELVALAENQNELIAILAHEIGHVTYRHGMRTVLQDSGVGLIIAAIMGDIMSSTAFAAAIPAMLVHAKYSRTFESEADDYALEFLTDNNIPPSSFVAIMSRLKDKYGDMEGVENYLSSHPATSDRISKFQQSY